LIKMFQVLEIKVSIPATNFRQIVYPLEKSTAVIKNDFPDYYFKEEDNAKALADFNLIQTAFTQDLSDQNNDDKMLIEDNDNVLETQEMLDKELDNYLDFGEAIDEAQQENDLQELEEKLDDPEYLEKEDPEKNKGKINQDFFNTATFFNYFTPSETPKTMRSTLLHYQKQALSWMKYREGLIDENELFDGNVFQQNFMKENYQEMTLINGCKVYFHPFDGDFSVEFPKEKTCKGGILADEMGLGKTVMIIALLNAHNNRKKFQRSISAGAIEFDIKEKLPVLSASNSLNESLLKPKDFNEDLMKNMQNNKSLLDRFKARDIGVSNNHKRESIQDFMLSIEEKIPNSLPMKKIKGENENVLAKKKTIEDFEIEFDESSFKKPLQSLSSFAVKPKIDWKSKIKEESAKTKEVLLSKFKNIQKDIIEGHEKTPIVLEAGTLIIVPLCVLSQWESEILKHSSPNALSVAQYYGEVRSSILIKQFDVILTSYGTVYSEYNNSRTREISPLFNLKWFRIILDEAHLIKSRKTGIAQAVFELNADYRWCITGTPLQNELNDLYSLLHFIRMDKWGDFSYWSSHIRPKKLTEEDMKLVRKILQPILLRRTKKSTDLNGKSIIVLPPKNVKTEIITLCPEERILYDELSNQTYSKLEDLLRFGTGKFTAVFEVLMRLRQMCNHPCLEFSKKNLKDRPTLENLVSDFLFKGFQSYGMAEILVKTNYIADITNRIRAKKLGVCKLCNVKILKAGLTDCGHIFCKKCIKPILESGLRCPSCALEMKNIMCISLDKIFNEMEYIDINHPTFRKSSKLIAIIEKTLAVRRRKEKVVIFSQFTTMMDLIQKFLEEENIILRRIDGKCTMLNRKKSMEEFIKDERITVMLMSLKTGGVGLNLTAANNVFVVDPWWNSAVEEQAIERVYRIGQTKNVNVIRFLCKNTVEISMQELKEKKEKMVKDIFHLDPMEQHKQNLEDLLNLVGGDNEHEVQNSKVRGVEIISRPFEVDINTNINIKK